MQPVVAGRGRNQLYAVVCIPGLDMQGMHTKIQTDPPLAGFTWVATVQLRGNGMHDRCISAVPRWVIENQPCSALVIQEHSSTTGGRSCQNRLNEITMRRGIPQVSPLICAWRSFDLPIPPRRRETFLSVVKRGAFLSSVGSIQNPFTNDLEIETRAAIKQDLIPFRSGLICII